MSSGLVALDHSCACEGRRDEYIQSPQGFAISPRQTSCAAHGQYPVRNFGFESARAHYDHNRADNQAAENPPGLGIDLGYQSAGKDLVGLLNGIASYERAVGRAFLAQRTYSYRSEKSLATSESDSTQQDYLESFESRRSSSKSMQEESFPTSSNSSHVTDTPFSTPMFNAHGYQKSSCFPAELLSQNINNPFPIEADNYYTPEIDFGGFLGDLGDNAWDSINSHETAANHSSLVSDLTVQPPMDSVTLDHDILPSDHTCISSDELNASSSPVRRTHLNQRTRGWTMEADNVLRQEVNAQRKSGSGVIQWSKIAGKLGGRTGLQRQARWAEVLDQSICKGRWSEKEDSLLRLGNRKFGTSWCKIAEVVQTRTQRQCRSRWLQINSMTQANSSQ